MVTVQEARKLIHENCGSSKIEEIPLIKSCGLVLAEEVYAPIDTPPFDQSAMDGYAFSFDDWDKHADLKVTGEVQAGNYLSQELIPNQAVRIFTGAALPMGTDTVVMQEKVVLNDIYIRVEDDKIIKGSNVRLRASQTKKDTVVLNKNHLLTPASISFLAGIGIEKVKIFSPPTISIIVTGKELIKPGQAIEDGKIYESNSFGLIAALEQLNITPVSVDWVDDDEEQIRKIISNWLQSDILILTGGVSVGDYDFVSSALEKCGVKKIFHKVKQKPGKPFYFGKFKDTLVFGLPGNPASVLTSFYEYVVNAVSSFTLKKYYEKLMMPLANSYTKKPGLTYFLKGISNSENVSILPHQESYMMDSYAQANCLIELEEGEENFSQGEIVPVLKFI